MPDVNDDKVKPPPPFSPQSSPAPPPPVNPLPPPSPVPVNPVDPVVPVVQRPRIVAKTSIRPDIVATLAELCKLQPPLVQADRDNLLLCMARVLVRLSA